jgi:hypothetical protein
METIHIANSNNISINHTTTIRILDVKNGHKKRRKRDVDMDELYHEPTPTPESFLEKIKHGI